MNSGIPFAKETFIDQLSLNGIGWDINKVQELHRTLGYHVSPTNQFKTQQRQWQVVKRKVENMLRSYEMSYHEAETLYLKIHLPKLRYFLPFTSLPGKVIMDITQQNIALFL
jgi:hypothetical protein